MDRHTQNNFVDGSPASEVHVAVCSTCTMVLIKLVCLIFAVLATTKIFESERFKIKAQYSCFNHTIILFVFCFM